MSLSKPKHSPDCELLCTVDVRDLVRWVAGIDRLLWPDWEKPASRPAVVADARWENMEKIVSPVIAEVMKNFPDDHCATEPMITTVHSGDYVPPHTDDTHDGWVTRIHVPIVTNKDAAMIIDGEEYHFLVGKAYTFDIRKPHAIRNNGKASRIHLMFDVVQM